MERFLAHENCSLTSTCAQQYTHAWIHTDTYVFFNEGHGAGTQWSCPPLSSIMSQRLYMPTDTPAQTEQEGFDVPDMLSIHKLKKRRSYSMLPMLCVPEGAVHSSAAFWLWLHILLSNTQPMQCWPKQVCLDNRAKHGLRRTDTVTVLSWALV